ncbi:MAG: hypothetical protein DLM72_02910 [Candidatus Nitrosopolaris wilkensis]|nr:MAG: hypothetical protein DLM72_02910 [Candidatus Nitrosopolaris wilkensis]
MFGLAIMLRNILIIIVFMSLLFSTVRSVSGNLGTANATVSSNINQTHQPTNARQLEVNPHPVQ